MKKIILLFILSLPIVFSACSGSDDYDVFTSIQGTVTDINTGEPLSNASVTLLPLGMSQQTDISGQYKFESLESQQYTVTVQRTGYQPNRKTVMGVCGETQTVDIQLKPIPQ